MEPRVRGGAARDVELRLRKKAELASKVDSVVEFHGTHDQEDHGNWADGMSDEGGDDGPPSWLSPKERGIWDSSSPQGRKDFVKMLLKKDPNRANAAGGVRDKIKKAAEKVGEAVDTVKEKVGKEDGMYLGGDDKIGDVYDNIVHIQDPKGLLKDGDKPSKVALAMQHGLEQIITFHGIEKDWPELVVIADDGEGEDSFLGPDPNLLGVYLHPTEEETRGGLAVRAVADPTDSQMLNMAETIVHEYGHHLTMGKGNENFNDALKKGALADWYAAIKGTETYKTILADRDEYIEAIKDGRVVEGKEVEAVKVTGHLSYLLQPAELFARSYSQYIAIKSASPNLLAALNADIETGSGRQWGANEFGSVFKAVQNVLKDRGLLRPGTEKETYAQAMEFLANRGGEAMEPGDGDSSGQRVIRTAAGARRFDGQIGDIIIPKEEEE